MSKKYLPTLVCGFGAGVLATVPGLKGLSCCLVIPAASVLALYLHQRINSFSERVSFERALVFGAFTGLFAALFSSAFDILITFITHTNEFVETLPQTEVVMNDFNLGELMNETIKLMRQMAEDIRATGFSGLYTIGILFSNLLVDCVFGIAGGLIGMLILNRTSGFNRQ